MKSIRCPRETQKSVIGVIQAGDCVELESIVAEPFWTPVSKSAKKFVPWKRSETCLFLVLKMSQSESAKFSIFKK